MNGGVFVHDTGGLMSLAGGSRLKSSEMCVLLITVSQSERRRNNIAEEARSP
jgi:hypothetical protein